MVAFDLLLICTGQNNLSSDANTSMYYLILSNVLILFQLLYQNPPGIVCVPKLTSVVLKQKLLALFRYREPENPDLWI